MRFVKDFSIDVVLFYYIQKVFLSKCLLRLGVLRVFVLFCALVSVGAILPLNLKYLHCLQHYFFEHLFNLYH